MKTEDFAASKLFNEKIVSKSKTLDASIPTVPFTSDGLANNEKSLVFYPTNSLEISKFTRKVRNHKAAALYGLTA